MMITDLPLSICQVVLCSLSTRQERGAPCLAESTSKDIRKQALAQQFVCGHWKGHVQDTTCAHCSPSLQSIKRSKETGHRPQALQERSHGAGASVG